MTPFFLGWVESPHSPHKISCFHSQTSPSNLSQLTFPEMESILLNCLARPRVGVLHVPQVISSFDNTRDSIEINLKRYNCLYQLHADGIASLDLNFKMQFGKSLLILSTQPTAQRDRSLFIGITGSGKFSWTSSGFSWPVHRIFKKFKARTSYHNLFQDPSCTNAEFFLQHDIQ